MKWIKYPLITIIIISGLFQLLLGVWILLDLESAGELLLGLSSSSSINLFEFEVLAKIAGKSFIMLFVYSLLTCYMVFKNKSSAFIMAFITGLMILLISITTYIDTGSYMVWITDFSRGLIIVVLSVIFKMIKNKNIRA